MAYNNRGNSIRQTDLPELQLWLTLAQEQLALPDEQRRQEREQAKQQEAQRRQRLLLQKMHRAAGVKRLKNMLAALTLISMLAFAFSALMYRQAAIYKVNFANNRSRIEISELRHNNIEARAKLLRSTDLAVVKAEALRLFGLRKPAQAQRYAIALPSADKTILYTQANDVNMENRIAGNLVVLESYMKSRQGLGHE